MARANVERFCEILESDEGLRNRLFEASESQEHFVERAVEMAGEHGIVFTKEDVISFIEEQTSTKPDGELSDMQLEEVAGGKKHKSAADIDSSLPMMAKPFFEVGLHYEQKIKKFFS
ncbi:MAG: Nif11 family protein [Pseudomonadota bacterium]